ncbi:hypothetical protein JZ751_022636 [Albula glossodonta]|uniref:Uncharacterized protein n=1 Tax=Albula glossodonta TaxID=121402 RepID=A0A8T2PMY8_9TELE|nr:hypothetical protein JZ751_022636 [Albula glossodonta]
MSGGDEETRKSIGTHPRIGLECSKYESPSPPLPHGCKREGGDVLEVHVGGDDYIHLRIFKPLPHTGQNAEMHSLQVNKAHLDVLEYF